jgi:mitogen-activated protein kinase organizer 1
VLKKMRSSAVAEEPSAGYPVVANGAPAPERNESSEVAINVQCVRELHFHKEAVNAVKFTSDGNYCMSVSNDRTVQLWNPHRDDPSKAPGQALHIKEYKGSHGYSIYDIAIHPDNSKFVSAGADKACFLTDVATGRTIRRIQAHDRTTNAVDMNDDGTVLITCSYDQTMCVWDLRSVSRDPIQKMMDFRDSVSCVAHSSNTITAGSVDGFVRTYDMRNGKLHSDYLRDPVTSVRYSNDQRSILATCLGSSGDHGTVRLLDLNKGVQLQEYTGHTHTKYKVEACFANNDVHVVGCSEDGNLLHWELVSGNRISRIRAHNAALSSITYHPKLPFFLTAAYEGPIKLWETK